jgi:glycosyltransferase involved in cell wall biosynthesis
VSEPPSSVTIATLSFNQRPFLERALRSVLEQDYPVEYIVVDPGSTDGSRELIESYRPRLAHVILEPDEGPADGLNKALALGSGDIFAWVNADDALLAGAISGAVRVLDDDPGIDVVYGQGYIVDEEERVLRHFRSHPFSARRFVYGGVNVMQQATFARRRALLDIAGFNAENRTCWDAELLLELALAGKRLRRVPDYWAIFRIHPGSITASIWAGGAEAARFSADRRRLFVRVMGREPQRRDAFTAVAARLGKWVRDPVGTALRTRVALVTKLRSAK